MKRILASLAWAFVLATVAFAIYSYSRPNKMPVLEAGGAPGGHPEGLPPLPAAPGNFGGSALEETSSPTAITNELLHEKLESEKTRMGIRRILPGKPQPEAVPYSDVERLFAAPAPAAIGGATPGLLSKSSAAAAASPETTPKKPRAAIPAP
jgi:hypothetical protein